MPSGAKKRKAAKKKLLNTHINHNNASYSQGSDSGDVESKNAEEISVKSNEGESDFAETSEEINPTESHNGDASEEHKSSSGSSSSSSDDDEVDVGNNKSVVGDVVDEMVRSDVGLGESSVDAEVVEETIDESTIPVEEMVNEVVLTDPDVVDLELNQSLNEVSPLSDEKEKGNSSIAVNNSEKDVEDKSGEDDHVKKSEEQPLISSTAQPVRRTSWMNCCGLFEVISGGSGR